VSFGCTKFFIQVDTDDRRFSCGLQVERGFLRPPAGMKACRLRSDWDWHRLVAGLAPRTPLMKELARLAADGFEVHAGSWRDAHIFTGPKLPPAKRLREAVEAAGPSEWCGFQVYYALTEEEVKTTSGPELVDVMLAVFDEVAPVVSLCSQVALR
jgi:hypothetical protein